MRALEYFVQHEGRRSPFVRWHDDEFDDEVKDDGEKGTANVIEGDLADGTQPRFTVVLQSAGQMKIEVIREIRFFAGLGLKEAKDLVEGAPKNVKEGVGRNDAEKIKAALEKAGATVEIKSFLGMSRSAALGNCLELVMNGHPLPLAKFNLEGYHCGRGEGILSVSEEEEIAEVVRKHGWYAASVYDHEPPFLYSIGLMQSYDHPEFIIFGLEAKEAHAILSVTIGAICAGASFRESGVHSGILEGGTCVGIRRVHPTQHELYLGYAMGYCRHLGRIGELEAVQVFWPDKNGKFPFDVGCDPNVYQRQPRLDLPLPPSEVEEFRRQWE